MSYVKTAADTPTAFKEPQDYGKMIKALRTEALQIPGVLVMADRLQQIKGSHTNPLYPRKRIYGPGHEAATCAAEQRNALAREIAGVEKSSPVSEERLRTYQQAFDLTDAKRFEQISSAAQYIGKIRAKHFADTFNRWRDEYASTRDTDYRTHADIEIEGMLNRDWRQIVDNPKLLHRFAEEIKKKHAAHHDTKVGMGTKSISTVVALAATPETPVLPEIEIYRAVGVDIDEAKFRQVAEYAQEFRTNHPELFGDKYLQYLRNKADQELRAATAGRG